MKLKKDFHPRMFGFAGFSGSGKTTLIEKIISGMPGYKIGYIKHDAHRFNLDHEGKDTYRQYQAGAQVVFINDPEHYALQVKGESYTLEKEFFKDCDLVVVEGHKYSDHPKFLFLDEEGLAEKEFLEGKLTGVIGTISLNGALKKIDGLPAFHRDDVKCLISFILDKMNDSVEASLLQGLILAGGRSSRMGEDKALLNYHGLPQARYLHQTLESLNIKSFISCRSDQLTREGLEDLPTIADRFIDFGSLGGILSAMSEYPKKAWLVIACDLPFVTAHKIADLISERDGLKQATAFYNEERKQFEPLFAIYEPGMYSRMLHFLAEGIHCPQKVLFNSSIKKLRLETQDFLVNANTPEERHKVRKILEGLSL
ncbi:MAG: molybdopterin-guanine dinucleotide biosynthesis protein B [Bacteriovoracaceae bacterium]|nr:molybdopterin-guanine dinucleotide biosynthesis protein B [Bacteriovoracaceae bacterium]